jgi:uncharacterized protein YndB with AHSA1/START domain
MHFEVSLVVGVPREKVYSVYTDFEAAPKWSNDKREVKVSRREGNTVYLEGGSPMGGSQGAREVKLLPPERVESHGETRLTRARSVVMFDEVPAGTRITASLDVEVKGRWSWIFKTQAKSEAESSAMKELKSFARYIEGPPSATDPV